MDSAIRGPQASAQSRPFRGLAIARLALSMMFHDRAKMLGTVLGVVFAVVLGAQQLGVLFGLLDKNTMFVDHAEADIWILPTGTKQLQPGRKLSASTLNQARSTSGVSLAAPLVFGTATVQRPWGGSEPVTLVGTELPARLGGPWNVVLGQAEALAQPDAVILEDSRRAALGAVNLGSIREINGRKVQAVGFTWGLLPFAPAYAFAELDLAREILRTSRDEQDFVLVRVAPGEDVHAVAARLRTRLPDLTVLTRQEFHDTIVRTLLSEQLGISFGTSTAFGLLIGFIIVALSMFSSVIDNLREFGTLKAVGVTNWDLAKLLLVQSVTYALIGSIVGLFVVAGMTEGIRSPNLVVIVPWPLLAATPVVMTFLCALASTLALRRVRKLEPGMVFR